MRHDIGNRSMPLSNCGLIEQPGLPLREVLTIGILPSDLKVWLYRRRGWRIGRNVSIGIGSVIVGKKVTVGDGVSIGAMSVIRGSELALSRGVAIGRSTVLAVPSVHIGEDARVDDMVWASAGYQRPQSALRLGGFSILMRNSYVNCAMEVSVGDGSGIGGHCLIFTHGHWLSWLDGYPRQLAPVKIGRDVWLPWRVFVMPGTTIGDGSVIGADSTVGGEIPPLSLAVGSPAKVVKTFNGKLPVEQMWSRLQSGIDDMLDVIRGHGLRVEGHRVFDLEGRSGSVRLIAPNEALPSVQDLSPEDTVVSMVALPNAWRTSALEVKLPWFDILQKERSDYQNAVGREIVYSLGAYGVRFRRL